MNSLEQIVSTIVRECHPQKIILFGSHAWGTPGTDSDVDLFVVKETNESTRTVARTINRALWGRTVPLDLVVSTPNHVTRRIALGDRFVTDVMTKGKVLYERPV